MYKRTFFVAVAAALVVVSAALASPAPTAADRTRAVQDCRSLRNTMADVGARIFRQTYGTARAERTDAFVRCVRKWGREEHGGRHDAAAECAAAREADPSAFSEPNAFGRCVAAKARAEARDDRRDTMNAARTCKAERSEDAAAFREKYGTGERKANAFGRCVSQTAQAMDGAPA